MCAAPRLHVHVINARCRHRLNLRSCACVSWYVYCTRKLTCVHLRVAGGYGWVVVAAAFVNNLVLDGFCYAFGVLLAHFESTFHLPVALVALSGSLLNGCYMLSGASFLLPNSASLHRPLPPGWLHIRSYSTTAQSTLVLYLLVIYCTECRAPIAGVRGVTRGAQRVPLTTRGPICRSHSSDAIREYCSSIPVLSLHVRVQYSDSVKCVLHVYCTRNPQHYSTVRLVS